ncbi:MAG TPA: hypothetical protein VEO56_05955 [Bacteroidota bacterium]|nr:hypothetical protein [Bacteroidota bacterium]
MLSPDVVWTEPENPHNPAGGTRHGHAGCMAWVSIGRDAEEILVFEPRNIHCTSLSDYPPHHYWSPFTRHAESPRTLKPRCMRGSQRNASALSS